MNIEVSNGEVLDKLSILDIKSNRVKDPYKLKNIEKERQILLPPYDLIVTTNELSKKFEELLYVNMKLWDIEDSIREKESNKEFDSQFIELARSVYLYNDNRAKIKREINILSNSNLIEEKSYAKY